MVSYVNFTFGFTLSPFFKDNSNTLIIKVLNFSSFLNSQRGVVSTDFRPSPSQTCFFPNHVRQLFRIKLHSEISTKNLWIASKVISPGCLTCCSWSKNREESKWRREKKFSKRSETGILVASKKTELPTTTETELNSFTSSFSYSCFAQDGSRLRNREICSSAAKRVPG